MRRDGRREFLVYRSREVMGGCLPYAVMSFVFFLFFFGDVCKQTTAYFTFYGLGACHVPILELGSRAP